MKCKHIKLDRVEYLETIWFFNKRADSVSESWGVSRDVNPDENDSPIFVTHQAPEPKKVKYAVNGVEEVIVSQLSCEIFLSDLAKATLRTGPVVEIIFAESVVYSSFEQSPSGRRCPWIRPLPVDWDDVPSMRENMMMMLRRIFGDRLSIA